MKPKPTRADKAIKPRRTYEIRVVGDALFANTKRVPVLVIDLSPASLAALEERVAKAIAIQARKPTPRLDVSDRLGVIVRGYARAALAAAGLKART
jgi:hypothetical protein